MLLRIGAQPSSKSGSDKRFNAFNNSERLVPSPFAFSLQNKQFVYTVINMPMLANALNPNHIKRTDSGYTAVGKLP